MQRRERPEGVKCRGQRQEGEIANPRIGIVKLGTKLEDWCDEGRADSLLRLSFSCRDHQLRDLGLPSLLPELSGCRGSSCRARVTVSYETVRWWRVKFGLDYARKLKRREGLLGDHWYLDEVFIRINGQQRYLWRAVDQDGDVIDILAQPHRDQRAA